MTVTVRRPTSRFHWVPTAAGWIVGVIATMSLISSVSPFLRHLIKVPREFIDAYLFNFPDTSFAWATVLALLAGALAARKRVAWWALIANLVLAIGFNVGYLIEGDETRLQTFGEILGTQDTQFLPVSFFPTGIKEVGKSAVLGCDTDIDQVTVGRGLDCRGLQLQGLGLKSEGQHQYEEQKVFECLHYFLHR